MTSVILVCSVRFSHSFNFLACSYYWNSKSQIIMRGYENKQCSFLARGNILPQSYQIFG